MLPLASAGGMGCHDTRMVLVVEVVWMLDGGELGTEGKLKWPGIF